MIQPSQQEATGGWTKRQGRSAGGGRGSARGAPRVWLQKVTRPSSRLLVYLSLSASYVAANGAGGAPGEGGIATEGAAGTATLQIG